jgi:Family of unknown function (DUF6167)
VRRTFWFAAGAGAGVYAVFKARRAVDRLTPAGLGDQLAAAQLAARLFVCEVREGMAEKETELRSRLGLTDPGVPDQPSLAEGTGGKGASDGHR